MTYTLYEQWSSSFVGPALKPQGFAIHWWGEPGKTSDFFGTTAYLTRATHASVHFVAEEGKVACLVSPFSVAWGQGDGGGGWGNLNLVSIECNPRCTAGDRETVAELMADQHITNGVPLVAYPHKRFTSTACPGVWEKHIPWLIARAQQIVAAKRGQAAPAPKPAPAPTPTPAPKPTGKVPYCIVEAGDTGYAIAKQFGIPFDRLAAYNPGTNWNALKVGQKLYLVNHCFVEAGDTGYGIAKQMGVTFDQLSAWNPGTNWNALKVGQALWLE